MKILHTVEFYSPSVGGMQEVVQQISERLVQVGHEVTVATSKCDGRRPDCINGVRIKEFTISGNMVRGMHGDVEEYSNFLRSSDYDIITCFAAQQWATDLVLPILREIKGKKVFVPTGFSSLFDPEYAEYFEKMKNWFFDFDHIVFLSENYRDIDFARKSDVKNISLIPNGASETEFLTTRENRVRVQNHIPEDAFLISHVGSHTGLKGHKEAMKIFSLADIENAFLVIIGNSVKGGCSLSCSLRSFLFNLNPLQRIRKKKILNLSLSRDGTVDMYRAADLFLFPSNIECSPLVLFESMASRTPFLTTDVGNAAEIIKWGKGGILLPTIFNENGYSRADIKKSVKILEQLWSNPLLLNDLKANGYQSWEQCFTWNTIAKRYEALYRTLIDEKYFPLNDMVE